MSWGRGNRILVFIATLAGETVGGNGPNTTGLHGDVGNPIPSPARALLAKSSSFARPAHRQSSLPALPALASEGSGRACSYRLRGYAIRWSLTFSLDRLRSTDPSDPGTCPYYIRVFEPRPPPPCRPLELAAVHGSLNSEARAHTSISGPCFVRILTTWVSVTNDQPSMQRSILQKGRRSAHPSSDKRKSDTLCRSLLLLVPKRCHIPRSDNRWSSFIYFFPFRLFLCALYLRCMHACGCRPFPNHANPLPIRPRALQGCRSSLASIFVLGARLHRGVLSAASKISRVLRR